MLGKTDYGALAALISAFLILMVGGQALQAAAAREVARHNLGDHAALRTTLDGWVRTLLVLTLAASAVGVAVREPLGALIGVDDHPWGAAALLPTGGLWMLLSLQRGVLQGLHAFKPVAMSLFAEAGARLAVGVVLAVAAGVTGAYLATPLCFLITSIWLLVAIDRRLGAPTRLPRLPTLRSLIGDGWVPIVGLGADRRAAEHRRHHRPPPARPRPRRVLRRRGGRRQSGGLGRDRHRPAAAAARDDACRRGRGRAPGAAACARGDGGDRNAGDADLRRRPRDLLRVTFGPDTVDGADALTLLGPAMTLLAITYLGAQYLFALGHARFLWALAVVAVAEVGCCWQARSR